MQRSVKEFCKGHVDLGQRMADKSVKYIRKSHHLRLMSDSYCKGIVRSQQEAMNLRVDSKDNDVIHAETIRMSQTESFYGRESTWRLLSSSTTNARPKARPPSARLMCEIHAEDE